MNDGEIEGTSVIHSKEMLPQQDIQSHTERREMRRDPRNHYLRELREGLADGNGKGMIRTAKRSSVLWLERQSAKKEGGAGGRQEYMKASCINGKVKRCLRINCPVSLGITNVII